MAKLEHGNVGQHTASPLDAQTFSWINSQSEQISMLGAFAMAVREGQFLRDCHEVLDEGTVRGAVSYVVQTFPAAGRQKLTKDNDRELSIVLSRQYQTHKNKDPQQKQQTALPFIVLNKLAKHQVTELDIELGQLTIGAAFFACCSCKYSTVPKREERCPKLLCLQNIRFFKVGYLIPAPSAALESADSAAITFEMQKNDSKFDTVIHGRTDDPVLCPVLQWARLINRILSYPNTTCNTPVCAVMHHGRLDKTTSKQVLLALCAASNAVGKHASASSQARWGRTPFAWEKQWKCILLGYWFIPSCLLADSQAMHFYITSESKWSSSHGTS